MNRDWKLKEQNRLRHSIVCSTAVKVSILIRPSKRHSSQNATLCSKITLKSVGEIC